jgi:50S ribosomal protein L16 3-hydroxylase
VLDRWLDSLSVDEFRQAYLGREPYSRPGTAREALTACSWQGLDAMLRGKPDALVVSRGAESPQAVPGNLSALRSLFRQGVGVVLRHAHLVHAPLRALCESFARALPGEQRVLVFATPKGTHGFGWHYDPEEVFIVQTAGQKQYFFRQNTIEPNPQYGAQPDFSRIAAETTPLFSCTLLAGDWLYLPRGMWHVAQPLQDSLSISIGVLPERRNQLV